MSGGHTRGRFEQRLSPLEAAVDGLAADFEALGNGALEPRWDAPQQGEVGSGEKGTSIGSLLP